ncbi:tail fiber assembly protein [Cronobacter sakazakii]
MIYFSGSVNGFFDTKINVVIPEDAVEVDSETYLHLMEGQQNNGCIIRSDENGHPVLVNPEVDYYLKALSMRDSRIDQAKSEISLWQSELLLGVISEPDKALLQQWIVYIRQLQDMKLEESMSELVFQAITWPEAPAA